jgi:hypothetical protein
MSYEVGSKRVIARNEVTKQSKKKGLLHSVRNDRMVKYCFAPYQSLAMTHQTVIARNEVTKQSKKEEIASLKLAMTVQRCFAGCYKCLFRIS